MPRSLPSQTVSGRLSSRIIATFVIIILVATLTAGALAYWLTQTELEKQAWARLEDGQRVTEALFAADRLRLENLVALTAQRPTLQQLLIDQDTAGLDAYITQYQAETDLDILAIYDASGQVLTEGRGAILCGSPSRKLVATFCLLPSPTPRLSLLGGQSILDPNSGMLLGYVMMAIFIDDEYEAQLAAKTGLDQSILVEGTRIATSLSQKEPPIDEATAKQVLSNSAGITRFMSLDGSPYVTTLFPLSGTDGEALALAEVALPVTGLKETERRILLTLFVSTLIIAGAGSVAALVLRKNVNEEAVQHLRSHFLANITHEFRTPLSALRASVEFLVDEMANLSQEEINELLHAIHMSVTGLQTLVDNLLESVSIEAGHFTIRPEPIELDDVVYEAGRIMQPLLNRRQQQLNVFYSESLPLVYGDSTRLTQVLVNLLANASKYGPMGQTIDLTIETLDMEGVRMSVADRGPGLSPQMREKLFHRFAQFNSSDSAQHGVGLGLWVVKVIVSEHDGTVGMEDRPGGGAIFWFTLPIARNGK